MFQIFVDSAANLPAVIAKKYNIPSTNPIVTWVAAFQSLGTKGISRSRQKKSLDRLQ